MRAREEEQSFRRLILLSSSDVICRCSSKHRHCHYSFIIVDELIIILIIIVIIIVSLYIYKYIYIVQNVITTNPRLDNSHSNFLYTHSPRQKKNTMVFKRFH